MIIYYGIAPFIVEVDCGFVPMVSFATVGQVSTLVDSVLNYTCLLGHEYSNGIQSQSVICTDTGQWNGPPLQRGCERKSKLDWMDQNKPQDKLKTDKFMTLTSLDPSLLHASSFLNLAYLTSACVFTNC